MCSRISTGRATVLFVCYRCIDEEILVMFEQYKKNVLFVLAQSKVLNCSVVAAQVSNIRFPFGKHKHNFHIRKNYLEKN